MVDRRRLRKCDAVGNFFLYIILSFLSLVNASDVVLRDDSSLSTIHVLLSVENVLLAILAVTIPIPDVKHMSVLRPIVLSLVKISVVLSTIFHIVYNKFFKPTEEPHESDEEQNR